MTMILGKLFIAAIAATSLAAPVHANPYQISILGTIGGYYTVATGMNDLGQVVGWSNTINTAWGSAHGILWDRTTIATDLSTFWIDHESYVYDINNAGVIVGTMQDNNGQPHAATWFQGTMAYRPDSGTYASSINEKGQIAGRAGNSGVMWGSLLGAEQYTGVSGMSINESGQIVGSNDNYVGAAMWDGRDKVALAGLDGKASIWAEEISDNGKIIGTVNTSTSTKAVIWDGGVVTALGPLSGFSAARGYGINNDGLAVGESLRLQGRSHATLWDHGEVIDLNNYLSAADIQAGWILTDAVDINSSGSIVANGYNYKVGIWQPFLLSAVPEPSAYALLLTGLGLFAWPASRKRAA